MRGIATTAANVMSAAIATARNTAPDPAMSSGTEGDDMSPMPAPMSAVARKPTRKKRRRR